jgi:hypothetical protein
MRRLGWLKSAQQPQKGDVMKKPIRPLLRKKSLLYDFAECHASNFLVIESVSQSSLFSQQFLITLFCSAEAVAAATASPSVMASL